MAADGEAGERDVGGWDPELAAAAAEAFDYGAGEGDGEGCGGRCGAGEGGARGGGVVRHWCGWGRVGTIKVDVAGGLYR